MPAYRLRPDRTTTDKAGRKTCEVFGLADGHHDISVAWLMLPAGCRGIRERHELTQIVIVLSGRGRAWFQDDPEVVGAGHSLYIPRNTEWRLENIGGEPLVCYAICAPAFSPALSRAADAPNGS